MGANLSIFKRSSSTRSSTCNSSSTGASLIELLRPGCLKSEKNNGKRPLTPEKKKKNNNVINTSSTTSVANITAGESSFTTLGECLLSSPGSKPDSMSGGELCVLRSQYSSRRVHPSSSSSKRPHTYDHAALGSKARLVRNGEDETADANLDNMTSSSLSRTQSENKSKKKVSFRLPEEADIIMFYPSEEMFTDCEDSV
ncbi:hypothetical protein M0R45_012790 [Rubus argutus]|uniref:Uncharacterized protein n=1 Tax=Rubus argutus TaxID=59490 RepID=A0AAW1XHC4_RUBAR